MEKKKRGRPKGSGNKKNILTEGRPALKRRGRKPKDAPAEETAEQQEEKRHNENYVSKGQDTKCKKCGITMKFFIQPPIKEEKLSSVICSKCSE